MPPRPVVPSDDLYARLEVPPGATFEAIEIAWRAMLKRHHPDVAGSGTLEVAKRINVAHDWLSDPELRARYDRERLGRGSRAAAGTGSAFDARRPGGAGHVSPPRPRRRADPAQALRRFVERVGRLSPDEIDRLSVAETSSIAFVASIHRFLNADQRRAIAEVEASIRSKLPPHAWADPPVRDAILAAAHELVLGAFLDEHLSEPFRGRARERLMRGWEAALDQPRYGPNTPGVERFLRRVEQLSSADLLAMVRASARQRIGEDPWPRGLDPAEDEGLRVSVALASRDALTRARPAAAGLDRATVTRAQRLLRRTAHAFTLRHGFAVGQFAELLRPWTAATGDPGTGRGGAPATGPTVRRGGR